METPRHASHVVTQNITQTQSPWHSPVPYLFGGLAAMLSLIAFALLILACSYWKLSGYLDGADDNGAAWDRDLEAGDGKNDETQKQPPQVFEEKFLVIMAGELRPTFLATPMSSRSSSFGDDGNKSCSCSHQNNENSEVVKQIGNDESADQNQTR